MPIHAGIENQVALADPAAAPRALQRLQQEGLTGHEALHAIGSVLVCRIPDGGTGDARGQYQADLEALSADSWRQMFAEDDDA